MQMGCPAAATAVFALLISPTFLLAQNGALKPVHTITAVRAPEKIMLDGVLNDKVWEQAVPATEFTQRDPDEGMPATERTELRIAFDDSAIYFGIRLFDSEPDKIVRRLSRRDNYSDADTFTIQISPYHDRLTGAIFEISAAGVQRDAAISNDVFTDYSWEGVWESAVRIDDLGWCAELRIPFSQLRFPPSEQHVWGINAARNIYRKNESAWLQMVPKNESGTASRMDDLNGLDGIETRRHLDLMPYVVGRSEFVEPSSSNDPFNDGLRQFAATGLDIKYGITSNFTLDATVNPDFGQVEVDPAVVNLSAFETFFEERRPFFIEGGQIFRNFGQLGSNNFWGFNRNEPNLFYTRRIGRAPQGSTSGDFVDRPTATTILGAGKLSGKTRSGWTLGLIEAVTSKESAEQVENSHRSKVDVEPTTNYFIGRVLREKNRGGVGFLTTGVQRNLNVPVLADLLPRKAYMTGVDGYFYVDSRKDWVVTGKLAHSWVKGSAAAIDRLQRAAQHYYQRPDATHVKLQPGATSLQGWTGSVNLNRQRGNVTFNTALWGTSPGFESNDLGFQTGGDIAGTHAVVLWSKPTPDRWTRSRFAWAAKWFTWDFNRRLQGNGWNGQVGATFLNYWYFNFNTGGSWRVQDDRLTRGGPAAMNNGGGFFNLNTGSDSRKKVSFNTGYNHGWNADGGWNHNGYLSFNLKPSSPLSISTGPSVQRSRGLAQYVKSIEDATATHTYGSRYVFADIDQFQVNMTSRINWTLNPKMSLQVFMQPLISVGDYWDFKEFARPKTFSFSRYGHEIGRISANEKREYTVDPDGDGPGSSFTFDDPDFNLKSLRINAIFRWEWRLGSTLYFVWTENRQDNSNPGQFSTRRDVGKLFTAHANDIFLVRLAWWFTR
jgi:hypothetical protein